ncbi:MAG: SGNH/GDSL hydrolase family protein [Candidatus Aureabacteria bacterium]|nr:SGNH/GDSL hydrolase family protein [Candidatus Auribacterota bacterium]
MRNSLWIIVASALAMGALVATHNPASPPVVRVLVDQPPVVPQINTEMKTRLRAVFEKGQAQGNSADVFSKIGDSITATYSFLAVTMGCNDYNLATHTDLQPVIDFFRAREFPADTTDVWCGVSNSFSRVSRCAESGWSAGSALETLTDIPSGCAAPYNTSLRCELRLARPSIALIMFGTNDLQWDDTETYRDHLSRIIQECLDNGVIPVLSTIPPRMDSPSLGALVGEFNEVVVSVAHDNQNPIWNYWLALQGSEMVNHGMSDDGVHPNLYGNCAPECLSGDFSAEGLRYGFNQRNFTALQVLDKIWRVVINDGTPDPSPTPAPARNLSIEISPQSPSAGGPLLIEVTVQPLQKSFDAWGIVRAPGGRDYSFVPGRESRLVAGVKPLARNVKGLSSDVRERVFYLPALPADAVGSFTVSVGLVSSGTHPTGIESAITGYADQKSVTIERQ